MASAQDLQATCEDYDSDQSEQGYEFPGRSSANAANVSTKRSHPDDLNKEKPPPQERVPTNLDLRSDSGYSSYTAATVSSTNSAQSAPSQRSPPAAAPPTARPEAPQPPPPQPQQQPPPPPSTKTRRPTQSHSEQPRPKLPSRTASQSSKPLVKQRRPTITQDPRPERTERTERERLPRRDSRVEPECTDPKCTTCGPNALPQHLVRPGIKPTQSARDIDRLSADTRSMRSDPASYYQSPPSPTQLRRPPTYRQEAAIVQPAVNPRRRPSTSRPRPMSYNGEHNYQYHNPGMPAPYPSPPQEHGPPPSTSAQWRQMPQYQMGGMAPPVVPYGAPQGYPGAYSYNHTPPPYDGPQRPGMPPRASFNSARNGAAPLITQAPSREQQYSARYGQPQSATQARFPPQLQLQEVAYESDSGSETGSSEEDDDEYYEQPDPNDPRNRRALMAPQPPKIEQAKPKSKSKKQQRPPMRHANTTQVVDERPSRRMSVSQPPAQPQSLVIDERRRKRSSRTIEEPSRRASVSRPAPPSRQIQSEYPSHRGQIVVANSSKSERRRSAQVYEQVYDHYPEDRRAAKAAKEARARAREEEEARREQEQYEAELAQQKRLNRTSKQYYQPPAAFDSDEESESEESEDDQLPPEAPAPPPPQARRRRPTDAGKGKERVLEHKTKRIESAAEEYISARRGAPGPLNDPIHNAARHSRTISMPSHSGSSGSERSRSNRTAVTNENNEIRLRVDANAPLSLQFNGDMEGRTLRMIPAENGMADLVISGGRDRESVYHNSDRGSNADDRKALVPKQPRRQAEEMTENSLRNSRRRRDSQVIREQRIERSSGQRPLRQRAHTSSYYGE